MTKSKVMMVGVLLVNLTIYRLNCQNLIKNFMTMPVEKMLPRGVRSDSLVSQLQQRYYFIRRLEKAVRTLFSLQKKYGGTKEIRLSSSFCTECNSDLFTNKRVKRAALDLINLGSMDRLYQVWGNFLAYKFIGDESFRRETILIFLLLYRELIANVLNQKHDYSQLLVMTNRCIVRMHKQNREISDEVLPEAKDMSEKHSYKKESHLRYKPELTKLLAQHHSITDLRKYHDEDQKGIYHNVSSIITVLDENNQEIDWAHLNSLRFYHIQRMLKSIFLLSKSKTCPSCENILNIPFTHPSIKEHAQEIAQGGDLESLLFLWQRFTTYELVTDETFVKDFLKLVIAVYNELLAQPKCCNEMQKRQSPEDILAFYQQLQDLPISEMLNMLDEVVEKFEIISQEYELNNSKYSWSSWFKKYWWAPPAIALSLLPTLLKHLKVIQETIKKGNC